MRFIQTALIFAVAIASVLGQTATQVDLRTQAKSVDFSSAIATKPLKSGSILPASCSVGDMYYKTDAPAGGNVYGCVALNTWALQSGGTLAGDVSGPASAATVTQIQGRAIAATAPSAGQALTWNGSASRWEPQTVSGASGNATQLQGRNVASATPADSNVLCWSTANSWWAPCASLGVTNPFTFPGKFTAAASGLGAASFGIPPGTAPSAPAAGDVWNVAGVLQFHNGTAAKTIAFVDSNITGTAGGITGKTALGNGSLLLLGSGSYAPGNITSIDANGNVVDGGLAVANIVRTASTYADPAWITSLAPGKVGNGTAQWNANQINGTSLAGLGTGLLKNTTGTGIPSIAGAADLPSHGSRHQNGGNDEIGAATPAANAIPKAGASGTLAAGWLPGPAPFALGGVRSVDCSAGGQFLQKINSDGTETCATPAGGGDVSGPGSSTAGNLPQWNGTTGTSLSAGLAVSATPSANAVVEAGPGATIAAGWIPDLSATYQAAAGKNAANGYAGLDGSMKLNLAQLPDLSSTYIPVSTLTTSQDILYRNGTTSGRLPIVTPNKCLGNSGGVWASLDCSGGSGMGDPGANGMVARTAPNTTTTRSIAPGNGITVMNGDGVAGNPTVGLNTAVALTIAAAQKNDQEFVSSTTGTSIYAGCPSTGTTLVAYKDGMVVPVKFDVANGAGAATFNWCGVGARSIKKSDGSTDPDSNQIPANSYLALVYDQRSPDSNSVWRLPIAGAGTGNVTGPGSSTAEHIPQFSGTTGKVLKDGLALVATVGTPGADTSVPTEKAVRSAIAAAGAGIANGCDPRTQVCIYDDFVSGAGDQYIGALGWGGGMDESYPASPPGTYGVVRLQTRTALHAYLVIGAGRNPFGNYAATTWDLMFRASSTSVSQERLLWGLSTNAGNGESDSDFIGIGFNTATDTNFMYVTRSGFGTVNRVSSGVAADTAFHTFRIRSTIAGTVLFSIDGGVETSVSTAIPTAPIFPVFVLYPLDSTNHVMDVDFVWHLFNISR